ncbi:MAG: Stf0 sulfotransferase, partial [Acidimicrobiaceae bacterium]
LIVEGETGWRELYDELGLMPYEVVYEDLLTDDGYERALRGILRHLDVDDADLRMPVPRSHRQADAISDQWVERYLRERE